MRRFLSEWLTLAYVFCFSLWAEISVDRSVDMLLDDVNRWSVYCSSHVAKLRHAHVFGIESGLDVLKVTPFC